MIQKVKLIIILVILLSFCSCNAGTPAVSPSMTQEISPTHSATPVTEMSAPTIVPQSTDGGIASSELTDPYGKKITDSWDQSNFPLYAMLKSDDIYLYGVRPYGMILYQNGNGTYFNWSGLTNRRILPELSYMDYNGDGNKEVAVTVYWGSGTAWSMMDLHILNIKNLDAEWGKPEYTDNALRSDEIDKWFEKPITYIQSKDKKTVSVHFDGKDYLVKYDDTDQSDAGELTGIGYGCIVHFKFDQSKIKVEIGIGFTHKKNWSDPDYFGTVEATVNFTNNKYSLSDYTFIIDENFQ